MVEINGERLESRLPGRQGRLILTFLVLRRHEAVSQWQMIDALWPADPPGAAGTAVYSLLSKLRAALGHEFLGGRGDVKLALPSDAWIDIEAARVAIHSAESAQSLGQWGRAWGAAQISLFVARRGFLTDEDVAWAVPVRRELEDMHVRSLETYAAAALHVAGTELPTAERAARELIAAAPFRESGYRTLMRALAAQGNAAEAILAFGRMREVLSEELGVDPSPASRALYEELLRSGVK
jgi:DNA-binding SARP family transcriptional activator